MSYFSSCAISSRVRMEANIALSRRLIMVVSGLLIVILPFWNFGIVAVGRYDAHGEKPQDETENENHHGNGDRIVLALLPTSELNNGPAMGRLHLQAPFVKLSRFAFGPGKEPILSRY